jgi:hypothetical protein
MFGVFGDVAFEVFCFYGFIDFKGVGHLEICCLDGFKTFADISH